MVILRKPDLVSCKTLERLRGLEIYLKHYFQRARLGGGLICEIGLYAVYTTWLIWSVELCGCIVTMCCLLMFIVIWLPYYC